MVKVTVKRKLEIKNSVFPNIEYRIRVILRQF